MSQRGPDAPTDTRTHAPMLVTINTDSVLLSSGPGTAPGSVTQSSEIARLCQLALGLMAHAPCWSSSRWPDIRGILYTTSAKNKHSLPKIVQGGRRGGAADIHTEDKKITVSVRGADLEPTDLEWAGPPLDHFHCSSCPSHLQMFLTVYLGGSEQHVSEVPVTPETLCRDVVELCKEPGEADCYLAELWRGSGRFPRDAISACSTTSCRSLYLLTHLHRLSLYRASGWRRRAHV